MLHSISTILSQLGLMKLHIIFSAFQNWLPEVFKKIELVVLMNSARFKIFVNPFIRIANAYRGLSFFDLDTIYVITRSYSLTIEVSLSFLPTGKYYWITGKQEYDPWWK